LNKRKEGNKITDHLFDLSLLLSGTFADNIQLTNKIEFANEPASPSLPARQD
jgi:hypothetical protein